MAAGRAIEVAVVSGEYYHGRQAKILINKQCLGYAGVVTMFFDAWHSAEMAWYCSSAKHNVCCGYLVIKKTGIYA